MPTCQADPVTGAFVNIVGTLNVFESAKALGLARVIYASSAAVFGASDANSPLGESAQSEPATHYGVFKRTNEGNARVYFLDHGLSSVGLRPLTVYGVNRDSGLTSDPTKAMKAAVLGLPFHIRFSGATDFQYVADTAAAFLGITRRTLLQKVRTGRIPGHALDCGAKKKEWRFKLSELDRYLCSAINSILQPPEPANRRI